MIRAMIFDLDGTLVDTEPLHLAAFNQVLGPLGINISLKEYFTNLVGYDDRDCFAAVLRQHRLAAGARVRELTQRKTAVYLGLIADRDVIYPGAAEFVRQCAARFPLMVVTGTLRAEAELILKRAGLGALFVDVIAAEDVEHGKPEPDGFLSALGRLGFMLRSHPPIAAGECLAVEDSAGGIEAAHRAGMKVLAFAHSAPGDELSRADIVRESIAETDLDDVLRRLARPAKAAGR